MVIKIEGDSDFIRDPETNAVVNNNSAEYQSYMKAKKNRESKQKQLDDLKDEIRELKGLLKTIIDNTPK
tara:strand:- start:647 stop:853 length:207 start_codon:yes stop_codon:yes gene_type:complete